ncbi:MAG: hypothetical protein WCD86_00645 [Ktedonobacteraceae bacterium]
MNMGQFITGILVENKDGATYEGVVYDRFLKLRLPTGKVFSIFDGPNYNIPQKLGRPIR